MSYYIGRRISYEWDMETVAESGDVVDHDHDSVGRLEHLVSSYLDYWDYDDEIVCAIDLVLVRDLWTEGDGIYDREWYYLNTDTLKFKPPLPTKYLQKEFEKSLPTIKKIKFKKPTK